jgi:predicted glutamine amidotransferase
VCELFGLSSKLPTRATFSLEEFSRHGGKSAPHRDGWGLAFYEGNYAQIYREAEAASSSQWMLFLREHQHSSQCVLSHIRLATQGEPALRNTQPFSRELGGRRHVFCHNGDLQGVFDTLQQTQFHPIGNTDSEYAFCFLMAALEPIWSEAAPSLKARVSVVQRVFDQFAAMGQANFLYSDGEFLYAYANKRRQPDGRVAPPGLCYLHRRCERDWEAAPALSGVKLSGAACDLPQEILLFASVPLSNECWRPLKPREVMVARQGVLYRPPYEASSL